MVGGGRDSGDVGHQKVPHRGTNIFSATGGFISHFVSYRWRLDPHCSLRTKHDLRYILNRGPEDCLAPCTLYNSGGEKSIVVAIDNFRLFVVGLSTVIDGIFFYQIFEI